MALDELFEKVQEEKISRRTILKTASVGIGLAGARWPAARGPPRRRRRSPTVTPTPAPVLKSSSGVGYLPSDHHAPLFIAAYKGADGKAQSIFEKHGVTVTRQLMTAGPPIMSQLSANKIDIGLAGVAPTITQVDGDPTVKIVAAVQSNGSGIIVGKDSGITTIDNLKGRNGRDPGQGLHPGRHAARAVQDP